MDLREDGGFKATGLTIKEPQASPGQSLDPICTVATNPKACPKASQGRLVQAARALCSWDHRFDLCVYVTVPILD